MLLDLKKKKDLFVFDIKRFYSRPAENAPPFLWFTPFGKPIPQPFPQPIHLLILASPSSVNILDILWPLGRHLGLTIT